MRRFSLASLVAVAFAAFVAAVPASAGTLDQQQTSENISVAVSSTTSPAQTFTAGISGRLDRVDLWLEKVSTLPFPVTVEIRNTSAGEPGTTVLATASVPDSAIEPSPGSFVAITFAAPPLVAAGTQYAIVASTLGDAAGWRYRNTVNPYSRGAMWTSNASHPPGEGPDVGWNETSEADLAFKTYVVPSQPSGRPPASCQGEPATHVGTPGDDEITGTDGDDVIVALGGNDKVFAGGGDDLVCGNRGRDRIRGQGGEDKLFGSRGKDRLFGGAKADLLLGGAKGDFLFGGGGKDVLRGGSPDARPKDALDLCRGGAAKDKLKNCER